jgi:hypothetical protein
MNKLIVTHNAGLFSCMSQRLRAIIVYANEHKIFPKIVDSSQQFMLYKQNQDNDITNFFLDQDIPQELSYTEHIDFTDQFTDYSKLNFNILSPIINQYFFPSNFVTKKVLYFENKYNIQYSNLCSVFYRGNDKALECKLATHDDFIKRAKIVKNLNRNIRFLVQTDDLVFLQLFLAEFENSIHIAELPAINRPSTSVTALLDVNNRINFAIDFIAAVIVVSRCNIMITHSGNCGYWASLYRGSSTNIIQHFTNEANNNYGWIS